jgi:stage II sporulation protein R
MRNGWWKKGIFVLFILAVLGGVFFCANTEEMQKSVAENVLRLHVVANSDSDYDQKVKLQVRNRILKDCGYLFQDCQTSRQSAQVARQQAIKIRKAAEEELRKNGVLQPVSVRVEDWRFPTKEYGAVRLPAGEYTALNVRIGTAQGRNWWCVLYPPLCLTGDAVKADEETLEQLRQTLTAEEYAWVTSADEIQVNVKFKLLELLEQWF